MTHTRHVPVQTAALEWVARWALLQMPQLTSSCSLRAPLGVSWQCLQRQALRHCLLTEDTDCMLEKLICSQEKELVQFEMKKKKTHLGKNKMWAVQGGNRACTC